MAFTLGVYGVGYRWLPFTISEFGQIPEPLNHLIGIFMAPFLLFHYWAYLLLRKWLLPLVTKRWRTQSGPVADAPLHAMALTLLENFFPQLFPTHMGHSWLSLSPYLGLAPMFGVPLYSFISYYGAVTLARRVYWGQRPDPLCIAIVVVFLGINGAMPLSLPSGNKFFNVRIVQPNIGNLIKMISLQGDPMALLSVEKSYYQLSTAPSELPLDLIIWPETAIADILDSKLAASDTTELPYFVQAVVEQMGVDLIAGGYDTAPGSGPLYFEDQYNALFHIDSRGQLQTVYHKIHLLPFGETMPFGPLKPMLFHIFPNISFFAPGKRRPLFTLANGLRFIPAICYEILFPSFTNRYLNEVAHRKQERPHFIVNLTNDSWYGDTTEPYQHLFLSRWRAIELALPVIRSTNTGITSILYPDGSESPRLDIGARGNLDISLPLVGQTSPTPYQRYGILPTFFIMILVSGLTLFCTKKPFAQ